MYLFFLLFNYIIYFNLNEIKNNVFIFTEALSSDEDDIDEQGREYLEKLSRHAQQAGQAAGFQVNATIHDADDDSDSDDDYEPNEETTLESYTTPLDESNCEIDEYIVFKEIMQSMIYFFIRCSLFL